MPLEDSYLGRGWSFPPSFEPPLLEPVADAPAMLIPPASAGALRPRRLAAPPPAPAVLRPGGVVMVEGLADIEQSLHILLSTRLGERVLAADFGCDLQPLAFEPLNAATEARFKYLVHTAVLYHEPRIEFLDLTATELAEEPGLVLLDLAYQVRNTNARHNYVYPFYLQEGSELGVPTDAVAPFPGLAVA